MSLRVWCVAVVTAGILGAGGWGNPARAAETYKVQLVRPLKVGDEYGTETTVFIKRAAPGKNMTVAGELHGDVRVLAVNERNGGITKLRCSVAKLTRDGQEIYPAGVVVLAERANHVDTITVNGQPATPEATEVLRPMLGLIDPSLTISDDEAVGTDQPQPAGVAWPVNKQLLAKQLAENHVVVVPGSVKGESKIVRVKPVGGIDAMLVRIALSYDRPPHKNPGKVPVLGGNGSFNGEILLPVDAAKPAVSMTLEERLHETELTRSGQATIDVDIQVTRNDHPKK